jgi:hypothetical protein
MSHPVMEGGACMTTALKIETSAVTKIIILDLPSLVGGGDVLNWLSRGL